MKSLAIGKPKQAKQTQNTTKAEKGALVDLNFKIDPEFKRDFKLYAVSHDMTQKQVLEKAFALLKAQSI